MNRNSIKVLYYTHSCECQWWLRVMPRSLPRVSRVRFAATRLATNGSIHFRQVLSCTGASSGRFRAPARCRPEAGAPSRMRRAEHRACRSEDRRSQRATDGGSACPWWRGLRGGGGPRRPGPNGGPLCQFDDHNLSTPRGALRGDIHLCTPGVVCSTRIR